MNAVRGSAASGLIVAAPSSSSGKTTVTLALLRALRRRGVRVASAKAGPDYIDPGFHRVAGGGECFNLDPWAMRPELLRGLYAGMASGADFVVIEGMMGLFDGAADGSGSLADLAMVLGLPVMLVVDVSGMSQSVAALVEGFRNHRSGISLAGVVLNRVGSERHAAMLADALKPVGVPVLASLRRDRDLALPSRHLGLVQAREHGSLDGFCEHAADWLEAGSSVDGIVERAGPALSCDETAEPAVLPPPGQRISVARDDAFAFFYPHMLAGWRSEGAEITFFSPLDDETPARDADMVFLPGGYPELHAGRLAGNAGFLEGLRSAADRGVRIYGECGGYMVLGRSLTDGDGVSHEMAGLLPVDTSFADPSRHLGYRRLRPAEGAPWSQPLTGHEFHYAGITSSGGAAPLFDVEDAAGSRLPAAGHVAGPVSGSFIHVIAGQ